MRFTWRQGRRREGRLCHPAHRRATREGWGDVLFGPGPVIASASIPTPSSAHESCIGGSEKGQFACAKIPNVDALIATADNRPTVDANLVRTQTWPPRKLPLASMSAKAVTIPVHLQHAHTVDRLLAEVFDFVATEHVRNHLREVAGPSHCTQLGRCGAAAEVMRIQESLTWKFH